jgi:hypothetical protein
MSPYTFSAATTGRLDPVGAPLPQPARERALAPRTIMVLIPIYR